MQYRIDGQRIVAFDDHEPFAGEISFPAVAGTENRVVVERVFVHPDYRGQGIAGELVRRFVEYATEQQYTVKLMCPYAVRQFKLHPEYQQLLAPADRFN
ncbi:GNAT family N-acetyltransferase [Limosilactobacillus caccae]|uniref:GNAT family N-acetyltransferase n=1 Tax=Limosilactobacillus caccae TaxID=1926284 RepID=UPI0009706AC1|nr:GNAT family N-acetyltransferase [Limosilactobacillus caccae]